ncbi:MAG: pentapeptide repeat-containing protein [Methanosarcina sp.]|uniref:pentapeptide repeat-containing protein n=1 Tax=Methanosarcina sp. TaxID=2213 RepID=UPI00263380E7|nr:P-loop NTPase fold protein [Methanosarcina sp.]MDD3246909.1 pentapeptide repeat-containing protein [Methanosarcina sp.]MDD4247973.1 pentapeptide repeat-containing protein [Methanosarcina sp.]
MSESLCCDTPTNKDLLGFKPYVEAIADFLTHEDTEAPITLSIEGQWGCGKSSFMKQLKEEIEKRNESKKRKKYFTVWFNSWRYEKEDELWAAFALSLMDQLSEQLSPLHLLLAQFKLRYLRLGFKRKGKNSIYFTIPLFISALYVLFVYSVPKVREILSSNPDIMSYSVVGSLFSALLALTGVLLTITPTLRIVKDIKDAIVNPFDFSKFVSNPDYTEHISFIENFHTDFGKIIKSYAENSRVYVFVDDLDRCEIPKAAELMQAINLMISDEANIYFCIGMDRRVISAGIASKHENSFKYLANSGLEYGYEFIEKFIQLPFKVPSPKNENFKDFITTPCDEMRRFSKTPRSYVNLSKILDKLRLPRPSQLPDNKNVQSGHNPDIVQDEKIYEEVVKEKSNEEKKILNYQDCSESPETLKYILELVASALDRNPRRIKQFLNIFRFQRTIGFKIGLFSYTEGTNPSEMWNCKKLAKFVAISIKWPYLISALSSNTNLLDQLQKHALTDLKNEAKELGLDLNQGYQEKWMKDERLIELLKIGCMEDENILPNIDEYSLSNLDFTKLLQISPVVIPTFPSFTRDNLKVAQEGQITERFTRAIDQLGAIDKLGNPAIEIRLGGIYALERIANESDKDYWPIMEILTAYIRNNSPSKSENINAKDFKSQNKVFLDIQAILTVIGRRKYYYNAGEFNCLELQRTYLREADLREANLKRADLRGADLKGTDLQGADLTGANLRDTNLQISYLRVADLKGANLEESNLQGADLQGANLEEANMGRTNLRGANLKGVDFEKANLEGADLEGADLEGAKNLTVDQLSKVKTLYNAILDKELEIPLREKYPALFEKPDE